MKKINILLILGLFGLLAGIAQPVLADTWEYRNNPQRFEMQLDNKINNNHVGQFNFVIKHKDRHLSHKVRHDMPMVAIRNMKMAIVSNESGDNIGVLLRGISKEELKSLVADGKQVYVLTGLQSAVERRGDSFFDVFVEMDIAGKVLVEPYPAGSKKNLRDDDRTYHLEVWNQPIKWQNWDLDGKGTDNLIETLEIAIERVVAG